MAKQPARNDDDKARDEAPAPNSVETKAMATTSDTADEPAAAEADKPASVHEPKDGKTAYLVTDRAGPKVAGRRVKAKDEIRLTEEEARADLLTGAIVEKGKALHDRLDPQKIAQAKKAAAEKEASKGA